MKHLVFPDYWKQLTVNLCHDWLVGMRGGERVIELLAEGFPRAQVCTLFCRREMISERITRHPIHTSLLQKLPGIAGYYRNLLPIFPLAIRSIPMPPAELAISTSHCVAKAFSRDPGTPQLCYCFTPMRYAWTFYDEYFGRSRLKAAAARPLLAALRAWDRRTARDITHVTAISNHVQTRIRDAWQRDSDVVYPPADTERCTPFSGPSRPAADAFDLLVSALVPYKRVDLAVDAYRRLGRKLVVVGSGSSFQHCKAQAPENVTFTGWLDDDAVLDLYRRCRMLVFPGEEDFGIVPVEAQACGKPVVAFARGGATETVVDGVTGIFFHAQTSDALAEAVETCASRHWDADAIRSHALRFGEQPFIDGMDTVIQQCLDTGRTRRRQTNDAPGKSLDFANASRYKG